MSDAQSESTGFDTSSEGVSALHIFFRTVRVEYPSANMINAYQCNVENMQVMYLKYKEQQESSKNQHL